MRPLLVWKQQVVRTNKRCTPGTRYKSRWGSLRTERYMDRETLIKRLAEEQKVIVAAEFEANALRKQQSLRAKRNEKNSASELQFLDSETKARRRACLKDFYSAQEKKFAQELDAKGLAFTKDRL